MSKNIIIIDDDPSIVKMLSMIIEKHNLGKIITTLKSGEHAVDEILFLSPDIVLIDLLLPESDGIKIIAQAKEKGYKGKFIMISQVEDQAMISKAYKEGTTFYIGKPINLNVVVSIVTEVSRVIDLERSVEVIKGALMSINPAQTVPTTSNLSLDDAIDRIFSDIGIASESGSDDLRAVIVEIMKSRSRNATANYQLQDIYAKLSKDENPRTTEQRIRRVIIKAFANLAEIGHDDYYNPIFMDYALLLFDIKQIKMEIRRIEDKSLPKGKTNVKKFLEGIIIKLDT